MEVQIISRESIKPSSPTPPHLRSFNFSFLDQIAAPFYIPILLFYASDVDHNIEGSDIRLHRLKISLSETLTSFYPIAGRINGNTSIECNDEGVDYFEARVIGQLLDVIKKPNVDVLKQLLPFDKTYFVESRSEYASKLVLAIQVNVFDCGGMVLSVCMSHKCCDASSLATFINCWSAKARSSDEQIHPISEISSLFPQRDLFGFNPSEGFVSGNLVTKRFVFDSSKIASLQLKSSNSSYVAHPTRVEAVSALIWKCFMSLAQAKYGLVKEYAVTHAVNLRGKMLPPPLPPVNNTLGNVYGTTITTSEKVEGEKEYHVLVSKLRDAIRKIDGEYVRRMQSDNEYMKLHLEGFKGVFTGEMRLVSFSSWCGIPFYEADFGWGKPIWVNTTGFPYKDLTIFMDTPSGDGIEAWVHMLDEDMAEFEQDEELHEFVSSTSNV